MRVCVCVSKWGIQLTHLVYVFIQHSFHFFCIWSWHILFRFRFLRFFALLLLFLSHSFYTCNQAAFIKALLVCLKHASTLEDSFSALQRFPPTWNHACSHCEQHLNLKSSNGKLWNENGSSSQHCRFFMDPLQFSWNEMNQIIKCEWNELDDDNREMKRERERQRDRNALPTLMNEYLINCKLNK